MKKEKISLTKEKIKKISLELFNNQEILSVTTNHIAKNLGISIGNLYYHYKNKEEIIQDIYADMSKKFETFNMFEQISISENPIDELSNIFDKLGELFWEYRFLMRDATLLMALDSKLKAMFITNQQKRVAQIEELLRFLISKKVIKEMAEDELKLRAKLHWFLSAYWHIFSSINGEFSKESIKEVKEIVFKLHIEPLMVR